MSRKLKVGYYPKANLDKLKELLRQVSTAKSFEIVKIRKKNQNDLASLNIVNFTYRNISHMIRKHEITRIVDISAGEGRLVAPLISDWSLHPNVEFVLYEKDVKRNMLLKLKYNNLNANGKGLIIIAPSATGKSHFIHKFNFELLTNVSSQKYDHTKIIDGDDIGSVVYKKLPEGWYKDKTKWDSVDTQVANAYCDYLDNNPGRIIIGCCKYIERMKKFNVVYVIKNDIEYRRNVVLRQKANSKQPTDIKLVLEGVNSMRKLAQGLSLPIYTSFDIVYNSYTNISIKKEFSKSEDLGDMTKTVVIVDPPWGSYDILKNQKSVLGYAGWLSIGNVIRSLRAPWYVIVIPRNYLLSDLYQSNMVVSVYRIGNASSVAIVSSSSGTPKMDLGGNE